MFTDFIFEFQESGETGENGHFGKNLLTTAQQFSTLKKKNQEQSGDDYIDHFRYTINTNTNEKIVVGSCRHASQKILEDYFSLP